MSSAKRPTRWTEIDRSQIPLKLLAEQYLSVCRNEGKTPATLRAYGQDLNRFIGWLDGKLGELCLEAGREYVTYLQAVDKYEAHPFNPTMPSKLSPATVAHSVRTLKTLATWLFEEGYTASNVFARLGVPRIPKKLPPVLNQEEVEKLLGSCDIESLAGCRDLCMLVLFLDTGLRLSELLSLQLEDVHIQEQWLKVMGKGRKERIVPFGFRAAQLLLRYVQTVRQDFLGLPDLFLTLDGEPLSESTLRMLFERLRKRTGISRLHPHLLRSTFATSYLVAGGDVFTLQNILGHTTLEMTRRYVALASSQVSIQQHRFSPMDRVALLGRSSRRAAAHLQVKQYVVSAGFMPSALVSNVSLAPRRRNSRAR
jgi:integrase/recombinase XerC/integrase/recombinase XerD